MSTGSHQARKLIDLYSDGRTFEQVLDAIARKEPGQLPPAPELPGTLMWSEEAKGKRVQFLKQQGNAMPYLIGCEPLPTAEKYKGNIENFIGMTQVPTGLVGPLRINGTAAEGDFYVPLATTEGALVASYSRGAKATRLSGGITAVCTTEGVQRTPAWKFETLVEVGQFIQWLLGQLEHFKEIVNANSRYTRLQEVKINMEGNHVLTVFEFTCGEAAGQNMCTIATDAICRYVIANTPVQPQHWFIESNYSGDKKATSVSFTTVRGKKVTAEAIILKQVVADVLNTMPEKVAAYWQSMVVAQSQSGSIGLQGHFANGLAALFLACGQDVACISEAYVGITRMEVTRQGDLYVAITLPSLIVGTVGGGTCLPTQQECLQMLHCQGPGSARKFAEICGALALAGELSVAAAIASGQFSKAHKIFRRK
jgi:hydroxymethylglutaryl-CoA reductase (NADPH)